MSERNKTPPAALRLPSLRVSLNVTGSGRGAPYIEAVLGVANDLRGPRLGKVVVPPEKQIWSKLLFEGSPETVDMMDVVRRAGYLLGPPSDVLADCERSLKVVLYHEDQSGAVLLSLDALHALSRTALTLEIVTYDLKTDRQ